MSDFTEGQKVYLQRLVRDEIDAALEAARTPIWRRTNVIGGFLEAVMD
jgi:hypothetical protein